MANVFVATQNAVTDYDGERVIIRRGQTRVEEGHPLLALHPALFEPVEDRVRFRVETARTEPTTTRTRGARSGRAASKPDKSTKADEKTADAGETKADEKTADPGETKADEKTADAGETKDAGEAAGHPADAGETGTE